jgi:hypothetical protein
MTKIKSSLWTSKDIKTLTDLYGTIPNKDLAIKLNRNKRAIATKAHFLKLPNRRRYWSSQDLDYLKRYYRIYGRKKLARNLNRTYQTVQTMLSKLGLVSLKTRKDVWTEEEIANLKLWYNRFTAQNIGTKLNRPISSIYHKANRLGLMGNIKTGIVRSSDIRGVSNEWYLLRNIVNTRDHNRCLICGYDKHISTHHIQQVRHGGSNNPSNLVTLCPNCHKEADSGDHSQDYLRGLIVGV